MSAFGLTTPTSLMGINSLFFDLNWVKFIDILASILADKFFKNLIYLTRENIK